MEPQDLAQLRHDLRTPLNHILGYSEMLLEDMADGALKNDLGQLNQAGQKLLSLVNELLSPPEANLASVRSCLEEPVQAVVRAASRLPELAEERGTREDLERILRAGQDLLGILAGDPLPAGKAPPRRDEEESAPARSPGLILAVDDNAPNLDLLCRRLQREGHQVLSAASGREALETLARVRPDLILLDVMMPEMDGLETCARIKKREEWRDIPVIFLTAKSETADLVRGFELGAVDYVAKPFHAHELLARVHTHLAMARLRRENEQLIRSESEHARHRSVAQMVAGVAHELNTPLGIIHTAADLITAQLSSPEMAALDQALLDDLRDAGRLIERNVARAHKLVEDFKKVSVNQITDLKEPVNLAEIVTDTAHLFQVSARRSRMEVAVHNTQPDQVGTWLGYAGSLTQVLLNLLSNAQRYAYPDGTGGKVEITLACEPNGDYRIAVRDFGKGIPPENLARVFEPFFTTGRGQGGSGLGMAIVYSIVTTQLQGSVAIDSTVDQGTVVTLRLPRTVLDQKLEAS